MYINIINLKVKLADLILLSEYLGLEPNTVFATGIRDRYSRPVFAAEEVVRDHPLHYRNVYSLGTFTNNLAHRVVTLIIQDGP